VTFANNIFTKSSGTIFSNPNGQTAWAGNIYFGAPGISVPSGLTNADPKLVLNSDGYLGLSSSSPAIDASSSAYPAILDIANIDDDPSLTLDISGQPRPATIALKDVGCDEYTSGAITNRPLTLSEVGPIYLRPATGVEEDPPSENRSSGRSEHILFDAYPNPFNPTTTIWFQVRRFPMSL